VGLMKSFLVIEPVASAVVLDLVESSCDGMQDGANDGQDKCAPGKVARIVATRPITSDSTCTRTVCQTPWVVAVLGSSTTTIGTSQYCDGNEGADEDQIKEDPKPPQFPSSGIGGPLDAREQDVDERVEDCSGEDTFNGTVRAVHAATGLDAIDETVDIVQASREDAERYDRRNELQETGEAQQPTVESRILEPVWNEACKKAGLLTLVGNGVVDWTVNGVLVSRHCEVKVMFPQDGYRDWY